MKMYCFRFVARRHPGKTHAHPSTSGHRRTDRRNTYNLRGSEIELLKLSHPPAAIVLNCGFVILHLTVQGISCRTSGSGKVLVYIYLKCIPATSYFSHDIPLAPRVIGYMRTKPGDITRSLPPEIISMFLAGYTCMTLYEPTYIPVLNGSACYFFLDRK